MNFSSSPNDPKMGSNEWYWCKCKLYQVSVDLEDLSFHLIFSITLHFHDRLASILMNFSSSPNDPKLGSNERYWCKCKLYQVWVDLEDLSFRMIFSITLHFHDRLASNLMKWCLHKSSMFAHTAICESCFFFVVCKLNLLHQFPVSLFDKKHEFIRFSPIFPSLLSCNQGRKGPYFPASSSKGPFN